MMASFNVFTYLSVFIIIFCNRPMRQAQFQDSREKNRQFYQNSLSKHSRKHDRPQSWYEGQNTERKFTERPQSIHEISLDKNNQHNSARVPFHENRLPNISGFRERRHRHLESTRSLSSSYSSQVGSSADEGEEHHGVYSAYDMTGRSPYGSLVLRRYSQSSLSSSSASWQQSTSSLSHHAVRGQWGSGSLGSSSPDKMHGHSVQKTVFLKSPPKISEDTSTGNVSFVSATQSNQFPGQRIRVNAQPYHSRNSHVYVQATPFSSGHHASTSNRPQYYSVTTSTEGVTEVFQNVTQVSSVHTQSTRSSRTHEHDDQPKSPSVKDLAKRFSGENQGFFPESFEELYELNDRERRRVKAQTWPKFAYVHSPTDNRVEQIEGVDAGPPKPPYPKSIVEDLAVVETKVETRITRSDADTQLRASDMSYSVSSHEQWGVIDGAPSPGVLASHRLSLQELIKIHEDEIARHAKSAQTTAHAHAQIYLKRPANEMRPRSVESPPTSPHEIEYDGRWGAGGVPQTTHKPFAAVNRVADNRAPVVTQYELTNLKSVERAPIKVVEVTEKGSTTSVNSELRERSPVKAKRHRTIGVVGFRQQIDRVSEGKTENKPKRHTAIGIVSVKAVATPARQTVKEETVVVSHEGYNLAAEKGVDNVDGKQRENGEMLNHRNEYDFHADITTQNEFQRDDALEELLQRDETSVPFARLEGAVQSRSESNHNRERKALRNEKLSVDEGLPRIPGGSSERVVQPAEPVITQSSILPPHKSDGRTWNVPVSNRTYNHHKPYAISKAVPVAQVSPVSPANDQTPTSPLGKENFSDTLPLSRSQSAREMYETRLALWNLYPPDSTPELHSSETSANTPIHEKIIAEAEHRTVTGKALEAPDPPKIRGVGTKIKPRVFDHQDLEEYYLQVIEKLKNENKQLLAKHDSEKRELKQKYEEQRKVANAYQKLEDRYRRRVHELQEALSGCTCQSPFVNQNHVNITQSLSNR